MFVEYRSERFYLQSSKRYFQSGNKDCEERLLHRRVWSDVNGPIPPDTDIHHKDGNWENNDISNLEAISSSEHRRLHMLDRWADEAQREVMLSALEKAQELAKPWHSSDDGIRFHQQNCRLSWENRHPVDITCEVCGNEFKAIRTEVAKTCSKSCRQKLSYKNRFNVERDCRFCGKKFMASKYKQALFCSRTCSNVARFKKDQEK